MSLMKTLAKVAVGVAVAKGASAMMNRSQGGGGMSAGMGGAGGLGGLLGGLTQQAGGAQSGGLQGMLGGLLGGSGAGGVGGLGGLLNQLGGAQQGGGAAGGLGGLLGGLGGAAGAGGLGGLLGGLAGATQTRPQSNDASFGQVLNSAFDQNPEPEIEPSQDQEAAAGLMLAAMIQATKADGELDDAEREKLLGQLGDEVDAQEAAFVQERLAAPMDIDGLIAQVPAGMGPQVYAMSVLAIDLDSQAEAKYLHALAQGLGMQAADVNDIHSQLGVPSLYT